MSHSPLRVLALGLLLSPVIAAAQTPLPKQSPFTAKDGAAAAVAANDEVFEFAGVSAIGKKTDIIIHDKSTKRKVWVGVGETVDGISVLRYDPNREQAVVRVNGAEKVLTLRKPTRAAQPVAGVQQMPTGFNVPPPLPAPAPAEAIVQKIQPPPPADVPQPAPQVQAPAAPQGPEAQAKAETEARMLVSDLLEIGMAQRKAYEDAQRNAAGRASEQPVPPPQTPGAVQPPGTVPPGTVVPPTTTQAPATPGQPGNE